MQKDTIKNVTITSLSIVVLVLSLALMKRPRYMKFDEPWSLTETFDYSD